jgi:hypothetical protein
MGKTIKWVMVFVKTNESAENYLGRLGDTYYC